MVTTVSFVVDDVHDVHCGHCDGVRRGGVRSGGVTVKGHTSFCSCCYPGSYNFLHVDFCES